MSLSVYEHTGGKGTLLSPEMEIQNIRDMYVKMLSILDLMQATQINVSRKNRHTNTYHPSVIPRVLHNDIFQNHINIHN